MRVIIVFRANYDENVTNKKIAFHAFFKFNTLKLHYPYQRKIDTTLCDSWIAEFYTTPIFISPDWLPLPTLASSNESKSKADSIIVVSCNNLSLDADNGVVTAGMEDVSSEEETTTF